MAGAVALSSLLAIFKGAADGGSEWNMMQSQATLQLSDAGSSVLQALVQTGQQDGQQFWYSLTLKYHFGKGTLQEHNSTPFWYMQLQTRHVQVLHDVLSVRCFQNEWLISVLCQNVTT